MDFKLIRFRYVLMIVVCLISVRCDECKGGAQCIQVESCTLLSSLLSHGRTPQLTETLRSLFCGFENEKPKICCPAEYIGTRRSNRGSTHTGWVPWSSGSVPSKGSGGSSLLPGTDVCGMQSYDDRIVRGSTVAIDEHPWMALLRYKKPRGWDFHCGGVLISSRYVLTAAHCVKGRDLPYNWSPTHVRLGEWNVDNEVDCSESYCNDPIDVEIEQIIAHDVYVPSDEHQQNDIALLRLKNNVQFTDFIKPICLPLDNALSGSNFDGYQMEVAGWGKTVYRSESGMKLKKQVPVVKREKCLRTYYAIAGRNISPNQLCAGGVPGKDSCNGDSGGPLMGVTPDGKNWIVAGVVSYGPSPCGTPGWPGVYTRVGAYTDWILSKLRP